ncbi:PREDICTED: TMV resistance protein N-like [Lupinus angustifolius]|uniref:TMV resistance protein N-like n=1 Tax=Lupinus angustifolius TaxID=3871 RepID=UPI00092E66C5|nr:PREDICTED: TMV resistance protein N-like [Lupinus angustifolius]
MSIPEKLYDVFISFRGEDTRRNFTSHLHSELKDANIWTYTDNNLSKGHEVWPALCSAIHSSHIAIVVFSRNYATSKWCLKELVKILECRRSGKLVVIPVFYRVDPSDIRYQKGSYGEAFAKHVRGINDKGMGDYVENEKQVSQWKSALTEAANISGWDSCSSEYKNDSELIKKIVKDVEEKRNIVSLYELGGEIEDLVGIDKLCEDVKFLLAKEQKTNWLLKHGQVIGIWGMAGIGKTTIAKAVFCQLFPQYDSVCFLSNVREESKRLGLADLHDRLLCELLKDENPKSTFIKRKLSSKKVFIVLDDVDSADQIEELCRECKYAGPDSKLIITTRNKHLLAARIDEDSIYEVKTWSFDKSMELFRLHVFKGKYHQKGYEDLSKRVVEYAGGLPLALKVLGSNLHSRTAEFWDSELRKLITDPNDKIQNVLQVSYDGLNRLEKKIFLDIAFFFKDEREDFALRVLNACGFHATSGMKVLEDKALITISNRKRIQIHDLQQEMGLKIVRQDIEDPGKRSRLRDIEEVSDVLENKKGSDAIEGIKLDLSEIDDFHLNADTFNMMTNLRFLILYVPLGKRSGNVEYPRVFNKFPAKLRYLEWHGYHLNSLPPTFNAKMLVEIRMPCSNVVELWWGVKDVPNLVRIDLTECKQLKNLPDLCKATKLQWVNLSGCESLQDVHPSILSLDTLETLIVDNCKKLKCLKGEKHLKSLRTISVDGCTNLKEFAVSSDSMTKLDLRNTGIEKLNSSIGRLTRLTWLNLEGLRLRNLPNELSYVQHLKELRISSCRLVIDRQKLHVLFDGLRTLQKLHLKDCCNLLELPDNINNLSHLYELRLDGSSVKMLPESIRHLKNLEILSLKGCMKLQSLPELPLIIKEFNAVNCGSLVTVSTLNTFGKHMIGKDKFISFQNCKKLDGSSLCRIMEGAHLTIMKAVTENIYVRTYGLKVHSYNYTSIKVCFPGSKVPEQFTLQTRDSSIPIKFPSDSKYLGIVLCAVLSPFEGMKKNGAKIYCQCYLADGRKLGYASAWHHKAIPDLNSDHVFMWYDAFHFDSIFRSYETQVSFMFYLTITNDKGEREVLNLGTKECGVCLIFDPQSQHSATITELETSDENRCNEVRNQELGSWLRHSFYLGLCLGTFLCAASVVAKSRHLI